MSKRQIIMILGVLVAVFLFLGFPFFWDKIISVFFGVCIILLASSIQIQDSRPKPRSEKLSSQENPQASYVDYRGQNESKEVNDSSVNTG